MGCQIDLAILAASLRFMPVALMRFRPPKLLKRLSIGCINGASISFPARTNASSSWKWLRAISSHFRAAEEVSRHDHLAGTILPVVAHPAPVGEGDRPSGRGRLRPSGGPPRAPRRSAAGTLTPSARNSACARIRWWPSMVSPVSASMTGATMTLSDSSVQGCSDVIDGRLIGLAISSQPCSRSAGRERTRPPIPPMVSRSQASLAHAVPAWAMMVRTCCDPRGGSAG